MAWWEARDSQGRAPPTYPFPEATMALLALARLGSPLLGSPLLGWPWLGLPAVARSWQGLLGMGCLASRWLGLCGAAWLGAGSSAG